MPHHTQQSALLLHILTMAQSITAALMLAKATTPSGGPNQPHLLTITSAKLCSCCLFLNAGWHSRRWRAL